MFIIPRDSNWIGESPAPAPRAPQGRTHGPVRRFSSTSKVKQSAWHRSRDSALALARIVSEPLFELREAGTNPSTTERKGRGH